MSQRITRLAPSPTGALHLGNARTFLINWALAKQNDWKIILRIEDLDTPRVKVDAQKQAMEDLRWLGMDWDAGPFYQMDDLAPYMKAIDRLHSQGKVYACDCSRSDVSAAQSAPNLGDHEPRYSGKCRSQLAQPQRYQDNDPVREYLFAATGRAEPSQTLTSTHALRLFIPDEPIEFADMVAGPQSINVEQQVGDFIIATKARLPAYQLAVVVDDARQGVTDIVRGDDLIPSAARQLWLYRYMNLTPLPRHWHLPLVVGEDGRRLAKRHGDTRLSWYRSQGVSPERIIGWIAHVSGASNALLPMSAMAFAQAFDVNRLPREQIVFSKQAHDWLMGAS